MPAQDAESRDAEIGRILNDYLDRRQRGECVSEDEVLRAHPDLAEDLRAHFGMVRQVVSVSSPDSPLRDPGLRLPSDFLPGYDILEEIHRGGQGVVYRALQKATRREVAIKVTREGPFAGWRDRARFEREVHVLGALRHPSIVTIHESGVAAGSQYFVMDFISGAPLDQWLERGTPGTNGSGGASRAAGSGERPIRELLRLFAAICEAINAAHIKGIIHRDLKPGNIRIDAEGKPHILDFGLAKVTSEPDAERRAMTDMGQFVGSLPWTSPEQAQGTLESVDTRTDVYALGVILYQMLTGTFPYDVAGPVRDVLNRIVTEEPQRPGAIHRGVDRDVDAIVRRCLRKEPARRYQTAGELGRDVERYLAGEPVAARSDSGLYVLGKMLRRYRGPVAVACAFALLVTASFLGSVSLWRQAVRERDRAIGAERQQQRERARADAQAGEALQARRVAEQQAERLRRIDYLNRIALARGAVEQRYVAQARRELEACPQDLRGWEWHRLMRLSQPPALLSVSAHDQSVSALALSGDGERVITGGYDGRIRIWDARTGVMRRELEAHRAQVGALAISPDGRWVASAGVDRTLRLWDVIDGVISLLDTESEYIHALAFSPDSGRLVCGGLSRKLIFREIPGGRIVHTSEPHDGEVLCIAYSPDGRHVASGESLNPFQRQTSNVWLWDSDGGSGRRLTQHAGSVACLAFSPDGQRLASGSSMPPGGASAYGTLKVCDAGTGRELHSLRGHEGHVSAVAFSPDGGLLASAGAPRISALGAESDHTLKVWDVASGTEQVIYPAHAGGGRAVAWSPDGEYLYSAGNDGTWKTWPRTPLPAAMVVSRRAGAVLRVSFCPDGTQLASSGGRPGGDRPGAVDETIHVRDLASGRELRLSGHADAVLGLSWSPDGKHLASGGVDGIVRVWNSRSGELEWSIPGGREQMIQSVAFGPISGASDLLASIAGSTATLYRVSDRREHRQLRHPETLATLAFSPDGQRVVTGSVNGVIRVWDPDTGVEQKLFATGPGLSMAIFGPDPTLIATGHSNGAMAVWDIRSGARKLTLAGAQRPVQWMAFSPDGQRIAACTTDTRVMLWDLRTGREVYAMHAHDAPVTCVAFSPGGRKIATCGEDGLVKLWDARPLSAATTSAPAEESLSAQDVRQ